MIHTFRYAAFISYSSKDSAFAIRLHRALESYRIPRALGTFAVLGGAGKSNRIYPVFRDRDELSAGELDGAIKTALEASSALIVICSPASVQSTWVGREIEYFAGLGQTGRIFFIIASDAPVEVDGKDATALSLRSGLSEHLPDAALSVLAADARKSKDGFRRAMLKCVAGVAGIPLGKLIDRDLAARRRRRAFAASVLLLIAVLTVIVVFGFKQQAQRSSKTLAELSATAAREGDYDSATRFALAGMNGFDTPVIGFDPSAAEAQLVQTVAQTHLVPGDGAVFRKGGREVVSTAGVEINFIDLETGSIRRDKGGHQESSDTTILLLTPDEGTLVTRGDDWGCAYNLETHSVLSWGLDLTGAAGVGPDGKQLLVAANTHIRQERAGIYNVTTKQWVTITASEVKAFSPDGRKAATIPDRYKIELFDISTGGPPRIIENATDSDLAYVLFSPDSKRLIAGGRDGSGETESGSYGSWNVETGEPVWPKNSYGNSFIGTNRWGGIQYSPDGSMLAISAGNKILLLDPETGATVKALSSDFAEASQVAFSPDSRRLAFGAGDRTIRLWDVQRAAEIGRFRGHEGPTTRLTFDQTGHRLMTVAEIIARRRSHNEIRVWSVDLAVGLRGRDLMARACSVTLADNSTGQHHSVFTPEELARASMLDPALHADVCKPPSLFRMLLVSLGF
ncbi:MAG TPA: TIR domain-containing protein [Terrimicrobiaceae bacterium]